MKKREIVKVVMFGFLMSVAFSPGVAFCQDSLADGLTAADMAELEADPYPAVGNNLGALGTGDNVADITTEGVGEVLGTKEDEITLRRTESGVVVYSGFNQVEIITNNSDGWVGRITENGTSSILFTPAGRPQLNCPAQNITGWFGPCKLDT